MNNNVKIIVCNPVICGNIICPATTPTLPDVVVLPISAAIFNILIPQSVFAN